MDNTRRAIRRMLTEASFAKRVRKRFPAFKGEVRDPESGMPYHPRDYKKKYTRKMINQAYRAAQDLNRKNPDGVVVYHMINPFRLRVKGRRLTDALRMLFSRDRDEEISVSTEFSEKLWDVKDSYMLVGRAKLLLYFEADAYTVPHAGFKMPQRVHPDSGSPEFKHAANPVDAEVWDEAIIRLSDVEWESLYYGPETVEGRSDQAYELENRLNAVLKKSPGYEPGDVDVSWSSDAGGLLGDQAELVEEIRDEEQQIADDIYEIGQMLVQLKYKIDGDLRGEAKAEAQRVYDSYIEDDYGENAYVSATEDVKTFFDGDHLSREYLEFLTEWSEKTSKDYTELRDYVDELQ